MTMIGDDEDRVKYILSLLREEFLKGNEPAIGMTSDSDIKIFIMEIDDSVEKMRIISISAEGTKVEDYSPEVKPDGWIPL
jgi:hypothetical protein